MITDINEDGKQELLVGTYDQTLFLFSFSSDEGSLYDAEVSRRRERGKEGERERGREEAWEDRERGVSEFSCDCFRHNHVLHRL